MEDNQMTSLMKYQLPDLPYDFGALEPVISAEIMEIHYKKHHLAYVNNLNIALEKYAEAENRGDVAAMIALQSAIRFNGGGHVNHSIFWNVLTPHEQSPSLDLEKKLIEAFGSLEAFIEKMSAETIAIQGSGWGWLGVHVQTKSLKIATCNNQDPLSIHGLVPLFGIDVWEHAYYLQYKNVRAEYVKNIWKLVDWKNVEKRLEQALK